MELPNLPVPDEEQPLGHCFGCGELNPIGLQLRPAYDGERVSASFTPGLNHQGWHNVTHGGILYSVLDEITAYVVLCSGYSFGVTAKSAVRFRKPSVTDQPLLAIAWPTKVTSRLIEVSGRLETNDGTVVAEVDSSFIPGGRYNRAFLWDMDGVIVDSGPAHYLSWREAFSARGIDYSEVQFKSLFGTRDDLIIRIVMGQLPQDVVDDIAEEKERRYREMIAGSVRVFPGVIHLLSAMRKSGFRTALGTSAPMANVDAVSAHFGLGKYFDTVVCGEDVNEGKPSPEIYLLAAHRLGVDPAHCVVFEDSPHGVEAAKRAGMKCVAITSSHPAESLRDADRVVPRWKSLTLFN